MCGLSHKPSWVSTYWLYVGHNFYAKNLGSITPDIISQIRDGIGITISNTILHFNILSIVYAYTYASVCVYIQHN